MKRCLQGFSSVAGCALLLAFLGQTKPPATAPAGGELERLRAENAELRKEIAEIKAKLAAGGPAQSQPAKKEVVRNFTTMMDVLTNVPTELRPQAKPEWYKFTEEKFLKWAEEQLVGMTLDTSLAYPGEATHKNFGRTGPADEFATYRGSFEAKRFTYFGADHFWNVSFPSQTFDEAGARKWDAIKKGTLFKVKGVIKSVSIRPAHSMNDKNRLPEYLFSFELRDMEMIPPK